MRVVYFWEFQYWLTWVVLDRGLLNGCCCTTTLGTTLSSPPTWEHLSVTWIVLDRGLLNGCCCTTTLGATLSSPPTWEHLSVTWVVLDRGLLNGCCCTTTLGTTLSSPPTWEHLSVTEHHIHLCSSQTLENKPRFYAVCFNTETITWSGLHRRVSDACCLFLMITWVRSAMTGTSSVLSAM